jgi:hypothetical protein
MAFKHRLKSIATIHDTVVAMGFSLARAVRKISSIISEGTAISLGGVSSVSSTARITAGGSAVNGGCFVNSS